MLTRGLKIMLIANLIFNNPGSAQERRPAAAGTFYPGEAQELNSEIVQYLKQAGAKVLSSPPRALIAPHAGYVYSGWVAAYAYKEVRDYRYDAIIIVAPCHVEYFPFVAVYEGTAYVTPLGKVAVDTKLARECTTQDGLVRLAGNGHTFKQFARGEHSLEVQLPFLQIVQPNTPIVPIVVGTQDWQVLESLGRQLGKIAQSRNVLLVASSDLSHYHSYSECQKIDRRLVAALEKFAPHDFYRGLVNEEFEACGGGPITAAMMAAQIAGANQVKVLKVANSGDVPIGEKSQVVGYLAAVFYQGQSREKHNATLGEKKSNPGTLDRPEQLFLLDLAEKTISAAVHKKPLPSPATIPERLKVKRGAFVTIEKRHDLRGCIGYVLPMKPLFETVIEVARLAALEDPRFEPVSVSELKDLSVEISVLTIPEKISDPNIIEVGKHGIIIRRGFYSGLLLPQVATDYGWDRVTFLEHTCQKAGLPRDAWQDKSTEISIFSAQVFSRESVE